jgi:hypothetical protein
MSKETLLHISGAPVYWINDEMIEYVGEATVCADGAPDAYGPSNTGTDYTENAGYPGNWWGVVTDKYGNPIVQYEGYPDIHPCPGLYVSCTCYGHAEYPHYDCRHWVDSNTIHYSVIPGNVRSAVSPKFMGCRAEIYDKKTHKVLDCVCAEVGPSSHMGEMSIAACEFFGLNSDPRAGGSSDKKRFRYRFWPGDPCEGWQLI